MAQHPESWLSTGEFGVRAELPATFKHIPDSSDVLRYIDPDLGVDWRFMFFPEVHMDISEPHRERLLLDVEGPARAMFEQVHRMTSETGDNLRTDDPTWSPIVDVEFDTTPDDAAALRLVHRMVYRPGVEAIMGHYLVPLQAGLFEARLVTTNGDEPTGYRESALILMAETGVEIDGDSRARQQHFDDPVHDERFATHPLTRARRALDGLHDESAFWVDEPGKPVSSARIRLRDPACSLVPPPRFFDGAEGLQRVTFNGTDGLQSLVVERLKDQKRVSNLEAIGLEHARQVHEENAVENFELSISRSQLDDGRELVVVAVDGAGHDGPLQNTMAYFRAADSTWALAITATLFFDPELIAADLVEAALRLEAKPRKRKRFGFF